MSISPFEIRRSAAQINDLTNDAKRETNALQSDFAQSAAYWSGNASTTFRDEYSSLNSEFNRLLSSLARLENSVDRLASDVRRADDERAEKIRAAAAKLAAEEALKQKQKK
ncbi:WXG100 family type VII secretion target [Paenibacillus castaneae]|uniref:WXG100 family type VII secretion target n=1 Tax=Paenibacillus castaneae TaxID=474957 RepID=UPI000C9D1598|nr:WXG100 family type VII secretion target [Paenibacillus castaneae]NIK77498.1 WXG100 family type VII secretion target [Paenibacillus castaneae]